MERKEYISPKVEIHNVMVESSLLQASTDDEFGQCMNGLSKEHDTFFDSSEDWNEQENPTPHVRSFLDD